MAFSPDGRRIVSGSRGQDGEGLGRGDGPGNAHAQGHTSWLRAWPSARTAGGSSRGSRRRTVKVWDAATGKETLTLKGHTGPVTVWPSARTASGSLGEWRQHGEGLGRGDGPGNAHAQGTHKIGVTSVAFSPDGRRIVAAAMTTVKVWDAATGQEMLTLKGTRSG